MGIWDKVKDQLRSVIQWENADPDALFFSWSERGDEIKNASKLIVGPGQGCIFVYKGKIEAVIEDEGIVDLETQNIPFWTTVSKFMQAFESEYKVGIYFFKRTKILDQKWGTPLPVKYIDPVYKFPVGLRAHGNFTFRIKDPASFMVNVVGGSPSFSVDEFRKVMGSRIVQPLTDYFAEAGYSYGDIDKQREEISQGIYQKITGEFLKLGFEVTDFRVEGTSFDEDTMQRINKIGDVQAEAFAAQQAGLNYAQMQQLGAMRDAAKNEGGGAGMGMGLGAGISFGNMMAGSMAGQNNAFAQGQPGPQGASGGDPMVKLKQLKEMLDNGLITQEDFDQKKKGILESL